MNSVEKGASFEKRVFSSIGRELDASRLGFAKESAHLYWRKGYFSRDREADIVVDISIEVWLPSATNWSLLWVCECKDYSSAIPIDDVEEFKSKLDQISGANRKGVIASTGAFQKSALRYAKSNGIGLIRVLPDEQVEHVLYQLPVGASYPDKITSAKVEKALLIEEYVGKNMSMFAKVGAKNFSNWRGILRNSLCVAP